MNNVLRDKFIWMEFIIHYEQEVATINKHALPTNTWIMVVEELDGRRILILIRILLLLIRHGIAMPVHDALFLVQNACTCILCIAGREGLSAGGH